MDSSLARMELITAECENSIAVGRQLWETMVSDGGCGPQWWVVMAGWWWVMIAGLWREIVWLVPDGRLMILQYST